MDAQRQVPHSYYPDEGAWGAAETLAARARDAAWEAADPNMRALATVLAPTLKAEGEAFGGRWASPN